MSDRPSLATRMAEARRAGFVGRRGVLEDVDDAIAGRSDTSIFLVHGQGGIGKSTLLREVARRAESAGRTTVLFDGRSGRQAADGLPFELPDVDDLVLLVDDTEQLGPVVATLRDDVLPALRASAVVVLAGRTLPDGDWWTDPGWRSLVSLIELAPLSPAESATLLEHVGVDDDAVPSVLELARGHPLALVMLAEHVQGRPPPGALIDAPDLVAELASRFVREIPDDVHRRGLLTCAHAWITTKDILATTVGDEHVDRVWQWLEGLSMTMRTPYGIVPHDLARDAIDAEGKRCAPDVYRSVHLAIRDYAICHIQDELPIERQRALLELFHIHRLGPLAHPFWGLRSVGPVTVVPGVPSDVDDVVALVEELEGPVGADLARRWLATSAARLQVIRAAKGLAAFVVMLHLEAGGSHDAKIEALSREDPVVRSVADHLATTHPLRAGEHIQVGRWLAGADDPHQRDPYALVAGAASSVIDWLSESLAVSFIAVHDAEFWEPLADYLAFALRVRTEVDGTPVLLWGNDWRRFPSTAWLDVMGDRELSGAGGPPPAELLRPPPIDHDAFEAAVRRALKHLGDDTELARSALLGTKLGTTPVDVRASITAAIDHLGDARKGDQWQRVLDRTFVHPAPSQEAAAEVLDLAFSTYRRHLAAACDALVARLWAIEIGEQPPTGRDVSSR